MNFLALVLIWNIYGHYTFVILKTAAVNITAANATFMHLQHKRKFK